LGAEVMLSAQAQLLEARGDLPAALNLLEVAWDLGASLGLMAEASGLGPELVRLACATGRRDRALAVTATLEEIAARFPSPRSKGSALRCRGLVTEDPEVLLAAVSAYRRSPRPVMLAGALEDAAVLLGRA